MYLISFNQSISYLESYYHSTQSLASIVKLVQKYCIDCECIAASLFKGDNVPSLLELAALSTLVDVAVATGCMLLLSPQVAYCYHC